MKRIRQGNTINFHYSVYRSTGELKEPEDLTGVILTAVLQNRLYGTRLDVPFSVEGNVITAFIPGIPFLKTGVYNFSLSYPKDGWDFAIDVDAFQIVDSSAKVGGSDACPDVEAETIELSGTLDFALPGGTGIDQVQADWGETDPASKSFIRRKPALSKVATTGSYADLSDKPAIPNVTNDFTDEEKEKLAGLTNYDDTPIRTALQDEINRAAEEEGALRKAVEKVASDFSSFLSSDPDADDLINRWQEVTAFLQGITEDKTLAGMLLELKTQINESVTAKLSGYYTTGRADELFVKKLVGSRLITEEEATKLAGLHNYDDTPLVGRVNTLESKQRAILDVTDWYTLAFRTPNVKVENLEIPSGWKGFLETGVNNGLMVTFIGQLGEISAYNATIIKTDILGAIIYRVYFHFIHLDKVMNTTIEVNYNKDGTPTVGSCIIEYVLDVSAKADRILVIDNAETGTIGIYGNRYYKFSARSSLDLRLLTPVPFNSDHYYEYMFEFTADIDNAPLNIKNGDDSNIKWIVDPQIKAGETYQVSIVNNLAVIGGA